MKIAYILHWTPFTGYGVVKKITDQIASWKRSGNEITVHVVQRVGSTNVWNDLELVCNVKIYSYSTGFFSRQSAWANACSDIKVVDLVYYRYDLYIPYLAKIADKIPLIIEINTDDLSEYCLSSGLRCWYNRLTRSCILNAASGYVFVSKELSLLPHFNFSGKFSCKLRDYAGESNGSGN